jgi:2-oxoacid:acceptor oxidoreductase gamma subunit (pyruvate/2-ketoisovalerate family)
MLETVHISNILVKELVEIIDVRINGRGGQGAVTASRLLGEAAILEGQYVHAFPSFGPERAGAPVTSFARISAEQFTEKTEVYEPHVVVVIDPTLLNDCNVADGLRDGGTIVVNFEGMKESLMKYFEGVHANIYKVAGSKIALEEIGRNVPNLVMLGSLLRVTGLVKLESLLKVTTNRFKGALGEKNVAAIKRAYEEVE